MIDADFLPASFFKHSTFNSGAATIFFQSDKPVWDLFPDGLRQYLTKYSDNRIAGDVSPHAYLDGKGIVIEKGTVVEAGAYLRAPCYIGADCQIRHGAYLRGNVVVGKRCVIGHGTEVKNSLLLDDAKAGHFAYIGDSVLGSHVNLGAGTKLANLKFNPQQSIRLQIANRGLRITVANKKLGALLADHVQTGCNAVLNPGTVVPRGLIVHPNTEINFSTSPS